MRSNQGVLMGPGDLASVLGDEALRIVDCRFSLDDTERGRRAYGAAHVPGAVYAHMDDDLSGEIVPGKTGRHPLPDPDEMARRLTAWGIGPTVRVVAYDDAGGAMAARLWWLLTWLGHADAWVLDGGWDAWTAAGHPVSSEPARHPPASPPFVANVQPGMVVSSSDVADMVGGSSRVLMDARSADRFRGENETVDPVAGHIPSAVSVPYADNLGPDGTFRSRDELRRRYEVVLAGSEPSTAVVYCGSGVTGAHDILAMAHAGLRGARLYAGSWSEWITDPSRPVATGA